MKITLLDGILDIHTQKQNYFKFCLQVKQLAAQQSQDLTSRETRRENARAKFALWVKSIPPRPQNLKTAVQGRTA